MPGFLQLLSVVATAAAIGAQAQIYANTTTPHSTSATSVHAAELDPTNSSTTLTAATTTITRNATATITLANNTLPWLPSNVPIQSFLSLNSCDVSWSSYNKSHAITYTTSSTFYVNWYTGIPRGSPDDPVITLCDGIPRGGNYSYMTWQSSTTVSEDTATTYNYSGTAVPSCSFGGQECSSLWSLWSLEKSAWSQTRTATATQDNFYQDPDFWQPNCENPNACDERCFLWGTEEVDLYYWPEPWSEDIICGPNATRTSPWDINKRQNTAPAIATVGNMTMTSPSAYLYFSTMYARADLGASAQTCGQDMTSVWVAVPPGELYSLPGQPGYDGPTQLAKPFNFANLAKTTVSGVEIPLVPSSAYWWPNSCQDNPYNLINTCAPSTMHDNYRPNVLYRTQLQHLQPAWSGCAPINQFFGTYTMHDPPIPLTTAGALLPPATTTAAEDPAPTTTPAEPSNTAADPLPTNTSPSDPVDSGSPTAAPSQPSVPEPSESPPEPGSDPEDPGNEDPGSGDPGSGDPGSEDPGSSDPGNGDPGNQDPGSSDPGASDPGSEEPEDSDPDSSDPVTSDPGSSDPGNSDPGNSDPANSDPGSSDPGISNPGSLDPGNNSDPGSSSPGDLLDPSESNPGASDPGSSNPGGSSDPGAADPGSSPGPENGGDPGTSDPDSSTGGGSGTSNPDGSDPSGGGNDPTVVIIPLDPAASAPGSAGGNGEAVITVGGSTYTAVPGEEIGLGSVIASAGGPAVAVGGQVVSVGESDIVVIDGGQKQTYGEIPGAVVTVGGSTITAVAGQGVGVGGTTTLEAGGAAATVSGQVVSLGSGGVVVDGSTVAYSTLNGQGSSGQPAQDATLSVGGPAVTIDGHTLSLAPSGVVVVDGSSQAFSGAQASVTLPGGQTLTIAAGSSGSTDSAETVITLSSLTLTADRPADSTSVIVVGSQTLTVGGPAITSGGKTLSAASGGIVVDGTTTFAVSAPTTSSEGEETGTKSTSSTASRTTASSEDNVAATASPTSDPSDSAATASGSTNLLALSSALCIALAALLI